MPTKPVGFYSRMRARYQAGLALRGVMINLVVSNNRIEIEVNPEALKPASLGLNSQLLKLAKIVP